MSACRSQRLGVVTDERLDLLAWLCPQPPVQRLQRALTSIRGPDVDAHAPVRDDGVDDLARPFLHHVFEPVPPMLPAIVHDATRMKNVAGAPGVAGSARRPRHCRGSRRRNVIATRRLALGASRSVRGTTSAMPVSAATCASKCAG